MQDDIIDIMKELTLCSRIKLLDILKFFADETGYELEDEDCTLSEYLADREEDLLEIEPIQNLEDYYSVEELSQYFHIPPDTILVILASKNISLKTVPYYPPLVNIYDFLHALKVGVKLSKRDDE